MQKKENKVSNDELEEIIENLDGITQRIEELKGEQDPISFLIDNLGNRIIELEDRFERYSNWLFFCSIVCGLLTFSFVMLIFAAFMV